MKTVEEIIGNVPVAMVLNGQESTWRPGILLGKRVVEVLDDAGYVIVPKDGWAAKALEEWCKTHFVPEEDVRRLFKEISAKP